MCKNCQKLWEIFAETQLECLKQNKTITKVSVIVCNKCKELVFIADSIVNNDEIYLGETNQ